jgi:ATP-dependent exoDNAse (exonuclease V) beta subunit
MLDVRSLATNYRSARNIIEFNNAFFTKAAQIEYDSQHEEFPEGAEQLRHAYADVIQDVPDKRPSEGLVEVTLLTDDDYQTAVLQQMADTVQRLMDAGAEQQHIAILVRINGLIPVIADYFAANMPQVSIVSDEAYRLDASPAVTLMVQALHLLTHPDDLLAKATVVKLYQTVVLGKPMADHELFLHPSSLDELLPEAFIAHTQELLQQPLYELAERLYAIFQLQQLADQSAYVASFYDQLSQFSLENSTDIDAFIAEWEQTICGKTIQSDVTEGIRILSIHKSKGLEFSNVIIPFCDWRLEHSNILWCQPRESPFDALPVVPVDYSEKMMRGTIYEHDYLDEHLQNTVDNLNLLYVAFTRAADNLFVIGRRDTRNSRAVLIEQVLPELRMDGASLEGDTDAGDAMVFSYGTLAIRQQKDDKQRKSDNVFLQPVKTRQVSVTSFDNKATFKQSNRSRDFMEGDDEQAQNSYIRTGSILHEVFSTIRTAADIEQALSNLEQSGILYDDELTRSKLTAMLRSRLEDKRVSDWFSDQWQLFNECTILHTDGEGRVVEHRPDRVMTNGRETHIVDFKFGSKKPEYRQQVLQYMQLLKDMGLPGVKGFIWYVYSNQIEEMKNE